MALTTTCNSASLLPVTRTPALTTVFTPPAFCSTRFHAGAGASSPLTYGWQDEVDPLWYSCIPSEWAAAGPCQSLTFSPAFDCPHGWTTAATNTVLVKDNGPVTFATCCMNGFTAALYWDGEKCVAPVVDFPVVVLATDPKSTTKYLGPVATSTGMATIPKGSVDHRGIVIGWQAKDLATASRTVASSTPTSTGTGAGAGAGADPGTGTPSMRQQTGQETKGGLSSGAAVGIAIGVVAVVGLILAGIYVLWRTRRRRRRGEMADTGFNKEGENAPRVSGDGAGAVVATRGELPSLPTHGAIEKPPYEGHGKPMYQKVQTYELPSGRGGPEGVYEMPAER